MSHVCVPVEALMAFGILLGVGEDGWQRFIRKRP